MTLAAIHHDLAAQWQRRIRRDQPTQRWAATDPTVPADPAEFTAKLADCFGPAGRDLLARIVTLAANGDHDAALAATLMIVRRAVRFEPDEHRRLISSVHVEHDALAASIWEAVVTEPRPDRPYLYERLTQVAWRAVKRPAARIRHDHDTATFERDATDANLPPGRGVDDQASSAADLAAMLDRLQGADRLSTIGRSVVENIAAGGSGMRHRPGRGARAADTARLRILRKLRHGDVHAALAG